METIPLETIAEVLEEAPQQVTQVIEVVETIDYFPLLTEVLTSLQNCELLLGYITTFALFAVVVCLCFFCYKFFRIFI